MRYDETFGIVAPEIGWVPAPRYLLRRDVVLSILDDMPRGRILEVGCGSGSLLCDLARMGFHGTGVDLSATARSLAKRLLESQSSFQVCESLEHEDEGSFDYLIALEVLEHIDDDAGALRSWRAMLKPDGCVILSVPADPERWSADDVWAGHHRRYDRRQLVEKLEGAEFRLQQLIRYGWPLTSFLDPIRARVRAFQMSRASGGSETDLTATERSERSGTDRRVEARHFGYYGHSLGKVVFRVLFRLQRLVSDREIGTGYIAVAVKA